jgi:hypothetical protein
MELLTKDISTFPIISFFIFILVIFGLLRLLGRVIPLLLKRKQLKVAFKRKYSFVELFIWLLYMISVIPFFIQRNFAFGVILSLVIVLAIFLLTWYAGRDIIAGFIIKANIGFKEGANIEVDGVSGKIVNLYDRNFKLINDKGEKMIMPYSQFVGKTITFQPDVKDRISSMMNVNIKSDKSVNEVREEIKYFIMTHPKALINVIPNINILDYSDGVYKLEIYLSARDNSSFTEIKSDINNRFGEKVDS